MRNKAWADVAKVYATRRMRAGKGKLRGRRHVQKLGPLVIYDQDQGVTKAFRNIPGVDVIQVDVLNLMGSPQAVTLAGSASGLSLHLRNSMGFTAHGERHPHPRLTGTFPSQRCLTQISPLCSSLRPSGQCCAPPTARSPGPWSGPTPSRTSGPCFS